MWMCEGCAKPIAGVAGDPVISAKSLGWHNYHETCAKKAWGMKSKEKSRAKAERSVSSEIEPTPSEQPVRPRFFVLSEMVIEGNVTTSWTHDCVSFADAERVVERQQAPSTPEETECNLTPQKYVNCTIYLRREGRSLMVEEFSHPMAAK